MSPFQQSLLAIEIAVDALRDADTEQARDALAQIEHLGFDTRPSSERYVKSSPPTGWAKTVGSAPRSTQPTLFTV